MLTIAPLQYVVKMTDATDHDVSIIGGGPAGLSAALFTAKNGLETAVFDTDATWMHKAHLFNYPGIGSIDGSTFIDTLRGQVDSFGAERRQDVEVTDVNGSGGEFVLKTENGQFEADYVVLATGAHRRLADSLGCEFTDQETVDVNVSMETSVPDAYATGAMVRAEEWQTVISAGDGAAAALNILSKKKGEHFHDFDVPADADELFGSLVDAG